MLARKAVLNALYYSGLQAALNPLLAGRGSILMLHHVRDVELSGFSPNYHLNVSPAFLDEMMEGLLPYYDFVSMDEVPTRLAAVNGQYQKPFLAITLDDGYTDNIKNAVPIFNKYNAPYTIYVAPEMARGKSTVWWEDLEECISLTDNLRVELPSGLRTFDTSTSHKKWQCYKLLMELLFIEIEESEARRIVKNLSENTGHDDTAHLMNSVADLEMIKQLGNHPLCTIGAHSMGHYVLSKLDASALKWELEESKQVLEKELGVKIEHLAYPYGFFSAAGAREFELAKELGFKTAVTTRHGVLYPENADHLHALPRVSINGHHQTMKYINTLLSGVPTRLKNKGRKLDIA